jgi:hypothetical protein
MCLRLTSFLAKCLFNSVNYSDVSSTTSEDDTFPDVPPPMPQPSMKKCRYNLRERVPVNYIETSDVCPDTQPNSDEE